MSNEPEVEVPAGEPIGSAGSAAANASLPGDEPGATASTVLDPVAGPLSAPLLSIEEIGELKSRAAKADENWERYVRALADLENFKKRAARERQEATRFASEAMLTKLLPVLDNFDAAMAAAGKGDGGSNDSLRTGVSMICSQLRSVLTEAGLEEIDAAGKPFDPNWHEAISQQESADIPEGHVLAQVRRGYKFRDRLLRPASVVVARKPAERAA